MFLVHILGFFTRAEVAKIMGVHLTTIRRWEKAGKIPFVPDKRGWSRFARDVVLKMADDAGRIGNVPGAVAGKCFELFANGKDWREVAQIKKIHPEKSRTLWELYWRDDPTRSKAARDAKAKEENLARELEAVKALEALEEHGSPPNEWERELDERIRLTRQENEAEERKWEEARATKTEAKAPPSFNTSRALSERRNAKATLDPFEAALRLFEKMGTK